MQPKKVLRFHSKLGEFQKDNVVSAEELKKWHTADAIIRKAEKEAKEIRESVDKIVQEQKDEAYDIGYNEGREMAFNDAVKKIAHAVDSLNRERESIKDDVINLVDLGIKKVLGSFDQSEVVADIAAEVLHEAWNGDDDVSVCVAPIHLSKVEQIFSSLPEYAGLKITEDVNLADDECSIVSRKHIVNVSISGRINTLLSIMSNSITQGSHDDGVSDTVDDDTYSEDDSDIGESDEW